MTETIKWLLGQWAEETARTLQSMIGERPEAAWEAVDPTAIQAAAGDASITEVTFSLGPQAIAWIAVPFESGDALGIRTLKAAGIDDSGPEDIQSTCTEIFQQAHAGLAQAMSRRMDGGITAQGREARQFPSTYPAFRLDISFPGAPPVATYFTFTPELSAALEHEERSIAIPEPNSADSAAAEALASNVAKSKTFDVLLDVSMPVSVSFGRTEIMVKDVLKLSTGSIVELSRSISEPVDVIVNDRIIARGEVVVIDGNYGVRINQIVSLQERFLMSTQAVGPGTKAELTHP